MKTNQALATIPTTPDQSILARLGQAANAAAARNTLEDYQARKAAQTLRRQAADVALFATVIAIAQVTSPLIAQQIKKTADLRVIGMLLDQDAIQVNYDMVSNLEAWSGVTHGLVEGFNRWQLSQGYAIGSINVRLATIKTYCELAARAGYITGDTLALIKTVKGFKGQEGQKVDEKRAKAGTRTRQARGKKASPVTFSKTHADMLKAQPDTKKGRRDTLLMCLLLDHGLRVGEIAALDIAAINLEAGSLIFHRPKVNLVQTHQLTPDTWRAAKVYLEQDCSSEQDQASPLFTGPCSKDRISERTINARLAVLGLKNGLGLDSLSPHDCRHYWATLAVRNGTDVKSLQDAGGWSSPAMPLRYAESSKIANAGVKLG